MTKDIVFFGTEDFSLGTLKQLVEANYTVKAVVTKPDSPQGRGHKMMPPTVKTYALERGIPVLQPQKLTDIADDIKKLNAPAGVLVSYGKIIPQSIIDLFTPGIINVHPSRLPTYRGPSPIESAILNGDTETGVSIMLLTKDMDAGPVYGYSPLELIGHETRAELYEALGRLGSETLLQLLPLVFSGEATGLDQDHAKASYCQIIKKQDGIIDWNTSAQQIEREIRAYTGWPQSRTTLANTEVIITKATAIWPIKDSVPGKVEVVDEDVKTLLIGTADGKLKIDALKPLGKKEMPMQAFLAGYRSKLT